jgi:hypothetical protein
MAQERHRPIFSHQLRLDLREELARWCRTIRTVEDDDRLRWCGIQWFTVLGHLPINDRAGRKAVAGRLHVIERRRDVLNAKAAS